MSWARLTLLIVGGLSLIALLLLGGVALGVVKIFDRADRPDLILHRVGYERLQLTITERGQLESADNKEIVCRVKARSANSTVATTIRWIVDDGTEVKRGDKLVQLDDSGLYEQLKTQRIAVDQALGNRIQTEKNCEIVKSQNHSDIETAKLAEKLTELDLEKYQEGEYIQTKQDIEGRMLIAKSDLSMWEERASWSLRMSRPGRRYVTVAQAQADEARLKSARIAKEKVEEEMRVLKDYTHKRTTKDLQGKIDEAKRALVRVKIQADAKLVQAEADYKAKYSIYAQEEARYRDIEDEIKKCQISAPQSGLVVYFVSEQSRFGSGSQQSIIAQGEPVREGQKLMRIPDLTHMVVNTRVHEAMISRVRGEKYVRTGFSDGIQAGLLFAPGALARLTAQSAFANIREDFVETYRDLDLRKVSSGQPAQVRVDAFPDRTLPAEVKMVATVASQQDWLSADVKVYQTMVAINETVPGLKPGMSAEVTVFTDSQRDHCLTVPVQAILGGVDMGKTRRVYVQTPEGPVAREVVIGLSNDKMAEVEYGLSEGDQVVLNPRVLLTEKEKEALGDSGPPKRGGPGKDKGGSGKEKGKGGPGKAGPGKGGPDGPGGPPQGKGS